MKPGSWSSDRAALPPEARAGGEPDDDRCPECRGSGRGERDPSGGYADLCPVCEGTGLLPLPRDRRGRPKLRDDTPSGVRVEWWEVIEGFGLALVHRDFFGPLPVADRAAQRFAALLKRRGERDVETCDID